ncbi:MAG: excinuclease ABC subunit UvrC, partial [Alphaproteobacteria bacterium]
DNEEQDSALGRGAEIISGYVRKLEDRPGVYRMIGAKGDVLYVGKARALKKRVVSYTKVDKLPVRLQRMVALTASMEFSETHTEAEALLLESNLIKKLKPRFNILMRDDKSFPYILLTGDHDFPTIRKHRGVKKAKGTYYGPFAGAGDVNRTIAMLQRIFMLRNCSDSYFEARKRPCLQYHIKRCTAPCVGYVSKEKYEEQIAGARDFLEGKSRVLQDRYTSLMEAASQAMDYEGAALFRDRIRALTAIQARQDVNIEGLGDVDVFALARRHGKSCVEVFFFRSGQNYGNRSYFPQHDVADTDAAVMAAFLAQFYENKPVPRDIIVSHAPEEKKLLEEALSSRAGAVVKILLPERGKRRRVLDFVSKNAEFSLERHEAEKAGEEKILRGVADLFGLENLPQRIEVYDNSHISGTNMVGAMIVAGVEGLRKSAYRKFNIKTADASDDYGMMREVLSRRFAREMKNDPEMTGASWPDIVLIDGGQGQYNIAAEILAEYGLQDMIMLVGIAKGEERNAGREKFFVAGKKSFMLLPNDPVLHYLQRLRDEAHRFAIGAHRTRRTMQIGGSMLDEVPGIGAKRKKLLLQHFGSAKAVAEAGVHDLEKITGISKAFARKIYDHFH